MDATKFLEYLAAGGGVTILAFLSSWLLEKFQWWHNIIPEGKKLIILVGSGVLGCLATFLIQRPDILTVIGPYLGAVILSTTVWFATQVAHDWDKSRKANATKARPQDWLK